MNGEEHLYAPEEDTTEKAIQKMFAELEYDIQEPNDISNTNTKELICMDLLKKK